MKIHPKLLSLTLETQNSYTAHTFTTSKYTHTSTNNKALTTTGWGKQKDTLVALQGSHQTGSGVWWPPASLTSINKLQVMQHAALRTATGCTQDTYNIRMMKTSHSP